MLNQESKFDPMDNLEARAIQDQIDQLQRTKEIFRTDGHDRDLADHHQVEKWNQQIKSLECQLIELRRRDRP